VDSCINISTWYLQKEKITTNNSVAPRRPLWKKMWNPRWRPRNGCDGRLMAKFLITTRCQILVKRGEGNTNSSELSLLKIFPLAYHHSHFLAATLDFTSFSQWLSLGRSHFLKLSCFGLDIITHHDHAFVSKQIL